VSHHLRVKICGITNAEDARQAALLGADAIGLNFHPLSPRYVKPAAVAEILRALPLFVEAVGVFVRETVDEACSLAGPFGRLRTIQRHGDEHEPADIFPFRLIDAFRVGDVNDLRALETYLAKARSLAHLPDAILVDGHAPGQYGGTGKTVPWELLADFGGILASVGEEVPLILAGGLTPENVAEAVRIVRPYGVDVASGVESSPGKKDVEKIKRFIDNARAAAV
jgi:phosphoribosylanthranilate isomerase